MPSRPITIRPPAIAATPAVMEPPMKPRERWEKINASVEKDLGRIKDKDQSWEDAVDVSIVRSRWYTPAYRDHRP
jgi:hypothetical protein